jgi:hypothetical protein
LGTSISFTYFQKAVNDWMSPKWGKGGHSHFGIVDRDYASGILFGIKIVTKTKKLKIIH